MAGRERMYILHAYMYMYPYYSVDQYKHSCREA